MSRARLGGSQGVEDGASCGCRGVLRFPEKLRSRCKRGRGIELLRCRSRLVILGGWSQVWPEQVGQEQDKKWCLNTRFGGVSAARNRSTKVGWQGERRGLRVDDEEGPCTPGLE